MEIRHALFLAPILGLGCFVAGANSRPPAEPTRVERLVEGLRSKDRETVDATRDAFLLEQEKIVDALIPLVDRRNADDVPDLTRCASAFILGQLRSGKAVPVLVDALKRPPGRQFTYSIDIYDDVVQTAIGKIERPAIGELLSAIMKDDDESFRFQCVHLMRNPVGGRRRLFDVMERCIEQAEDPVAIERLKKAKAIMIPFDEPQEPLF